MRRLYEVCFRPEHRDNLLSLASGDELAAVIERMATSGEITCEFIDVIPQDTHAPVLFIGVSSVRGVGSIEYASVTENLFSKGAWRSDKTVIYLDFGNPRYFRPDSLIQLDDLKSAAKCFYRKVAELVGFTTPCAAIRNCAGPEQIPGFGPGGPGCAAPLVQLLEPHGTSIARGG
ncbi:Imm1 family immunity protein [Nocardia sp. NPDC004123]